MDVSVQTVESFKKMRAQEGRQHTIIFADPLHAAPRFMNKTQMGHSLNS